MKQKKLQLLETLLFAPLLL